MRISTVQVYTQGQRTFAEQQVKLATLQEQIATGRRLINPSDDPAAASRILELEQTIEMAEQHQENINVARDRLQLQETVLVSVENALFRMRDLTVQANNGSLSNEGLEAIATEIDQLREQMLSSANTTDANGAYLFAGYQSGQAPFVANTTGALDHVAFIGDQGERRLAISPTREIGVDTSGRALFMQVQSATGLSVAAEATNSGDGQIAPAQVLDPGSYSASSYSVVFDTASSYQVFDVSGAPTLVTSGAYSDGGVIEFNGIRTSVSGSPDVGDTFTIDQGQYRDVFGIAGELSTVLQGVGLTNDQRAEYLAQSLTDIDTAIDNLLLARTSIGGRLNALDFQGEDNEALIIRSQATVGELRDVDLAEAISQLSLEQATLDAAQAVFARITSSSLFNFLR